MKAARALLAAILVAGIVTVVPSSSASAAASYCSLVGHIGAGADQLTVVDTLDPSPATNETIQGTIGTLAIYGTTTAPSTKTLYGIEDDQLGIIDYDTAAFTPATLTTGSGNGDLGLQPLNNVYAITFTTGGTMYGISIRAGDDLLFEIDPATGAAVPNAFGVGQDYEVVDTTSGFPGGTDLKEIAVDPVSSKIYGIAREPGGVSNLVTVDFIYGDPDVTHLTVIGSSMVNIYGFAFDDSGTAWALRRDGRLYQVDTATGIGTLITTMDDMTEYTSVSCGPIVPVPNQAPVFDQDLGNRTDAENDAISLSAAATDPDGDGLLYTATGLPDGLTINSGSGLITGTISYTAAAASPYAVEITVTDDGTPNLDATDTFTWTVTNTNRPPTVTAIANDSTPEGSPYSLTVTATDPDGDSLILSAAGLPGWATFTDNTDNTGTISGTPGYTDAGTSSITITATDPFSATDEDSYSLTVTNTNRNPIFDLDLGDRTDAENDAISLSAAATDPDGDGLLYTATGLPDGLTINSGSGLITGTISYTAAAASPYAVEITVTDDGTPNLDDTDTYTWTITNTNRNPIFDLDLGDRTDAENDAISLSATATDPDGDGLLYTATGLPDGLTINSGSGLITGTISYTAAAASPYAVEITVTDDGTPNLDDTDTYTWTITNTNRNPVFDNDLADQDDDENDVISLSAAATDPDGDGLLYSATGLPDGLSISPTSGLITGTISFDAAADSPYAVEITVVDDGSPNLAASDTFTWIVYNTNRAPVVNAEGYVIDVDETLTIAAPGVLNNDYDPDGDPLTLTLKNDVDKGVLSLSADGSFTYTPPLGYVGEAKFKYEIQDPAGASVDVEIVITVDSNATVGELYLSSVVIDADTFELSPVPPVAAVLPDHEPDGSPGLTILEGEGKDDETDPALFQWWDFDVTSDLELRGPAAVEIYAAVAGFVLNERSVAETWLFDCDATGTVCVELSAQDLNRQPWDSGTPTYDLHRVELGHIDHTIIAGRKLRLMLQFRKQDMWVAFDTVTYPARLEFVIANQPPLINPPSDQTGSEGTPFSLTVVATDPENHPISWSSSGLPTWASLTDNTDGTATISGTPGYADTGSSTVTVIASDGTATDQSSFELTIGDVNRPPVFAVDIGDTTTPEGTMINLATDATDPDDDTLTWAITGLPDGLSFNPGTGHISGTITYAAEGSYSVEVRVTDDGSPSLGDVDTFTWTITNTNRAPSFSGNITSRTDPENTSITLKSPATDVDDDGLTYSASGLPPGLSIDPGTGTISGTTTKTAEGTYAVTITVTDDGSPALSDVDTFTWTIINRAPVFGTDLTNRTDSENATVSLLAAASDPDGDTLSYSATGLPSGLSINPSSGLISGTIGYTAAGSQTTTIRVSDGTTTSIDAFVWTVTDTNRHPTFIADLTTRTSSEGAAVSLAAAASDPDGDSLSYTATGLPPGLSIHPTTGLVTGTLSYASAGTYSVAITAADSGLPTLTSVDTFTWSVTNTNRAPVLSALADRTVAERNSLSVAISAGDPDGDSITLQAAGLPSWATLVDRGNGTGSITGTPLRAHVGTTVVAVSAGDGSLSAVKTFRITVTSPNQPPLLTSIPDQAVTAGDPWSLTITASDPDGAGTTVTVSGPGWITQVPTTSGVRLSGTPSYLDEGETTVTVVAVDEAGDRATGTFRLGVLVPNRPPSVEVIRNERGREGSLFEALVAVADPDDDDATLRTSGSLPDWLQLRSGPTTGLYILGGTAPPDGAGTFTVGLIASDGAAETSSTLSIVINDWLRPPTVLPDIGVVEAGASLEISVLSNDTAVNGLLRIVGVGEPSHGFARLLPGGTIGYQPNSGYTGKDSFMYTVEDEDGQQASAVVSLNVVSAAAYVAYATKEASGVFASDLQSDPASQSAANTIHNLGPTEGLTVAFSTAVESLQTGAFSSLGLGVLIGWLLLLGVDRRRKESAVS